MAAVIGIAGELVKGATPSLATRRDDPRRPLDEAELERLVRRAQDRALNEAEERIRWESGVDRLDVRLVHAAIVEMTIDGYPVSNPIGFTGAQVELRVFNAFAPMVHLGALQSVADALGLQLLGRDRRAVRSRHLPGAGRARRRWSRLRRHRRRHDRRRPRAWRRDRGTKMLALGGRAFTRGWPSASASPSPMRSAPSSRPAPTTPPRSRALLDDARIWRDGVELMIGDLAGRRAPPGRVLLCGGGADLPQVSTVLDEDGWWQRLPFARRPQVRAIAPDEVVGLRDATGQLSDAAGRDADGARAPGPRPRRRRVRRRSRHAQRRARDAAVSERPTVVYLEADDEITTVVRRVRAADAGARSCSSRRVGRARRRARSRCGSWREPARPTGATSRSSATP